MTDEQVIAMLQMQAAQVGLLLEIRDLLREGVLASEGDDPDVVFMECQHPEASRVDLSTPGDRGHWVCNECRFDSKAVA